MESMSVTLDEVLAAARARAASLVPETSGYLALAVADASARLPFLVEDPLVTLSTEGTVHVKRGSRVAEPADSAFVMRDMLGRLLSLSIGSAPALAGAARSRTSADAVDVFIQELENALVPVNRAAARRALARLARETVRAKEAGRLRKKRRSEAASPPKREPAPEPRPITAYVTPPPARVTEPAAPPPRASSPAVSARRVAEASERSHRAEPRAVAQAAPPTPPTPAPIDVDVDVDDLSGTPVEEAPVVVSDATMIDTEYVDRALLLEPLRHSDVGAPKSEVDALLAQFTVTSQPLDGAHRVFKTLAGMEPTPPPPAAAELAELVARAAPPGAVAAITEPRATRRAPSVPPAPPSQSEPIALVSKKVRVEVRPLEEVRATLASKVPSRARPPEPEAVAETEDEATFYGSGDVDGTEGAAPARPSRWPLAVALVVGFCVAASLGHFVPSWIAAADSATQP